MESGIRCSKAMVYSTIFMKTGGIVAVCVVLLATGGCSPAGESSQASAIADGRVSKGQDTIAHADETSLERCPAPPELTGCTRIEVTHIPSVLRAIGFIGPPRILDPDERQYVESFNVVVVDDPERIKVLAQSLRTGSYINYGALQMEPWADVICYRDDVRLASFTDYGFIIRTQEGYCFQYGSAPMHFKDVAPEIYPFYLRRRCATLLRRIGRELPDWSREGNAWPAPHEWSDWVFQRFITRRGTPVAADSPAMRSIAERFVCPSARGGRCHYALNPDCEPHSPGDMVLLFETKGGWNQHGGPELFTFDNHDPKGGCVLLNDGTVKFIRTQEELHALRWK